MWYNEERPYNFDEVKGQEEIVKGIRSQSIRNKFFQIYIFGGQYGGGKTTMARIVARAANCEHKDEHGNPCLECETCKAILQGRCQDVVEMDGASNTSVDDIRALKESTSYLPVDVKKKVYIIDEVHMLSKGAFNALLKLLEEPPEHVIIILCTTDVKMIPNTVKSRAAKYTFLPINHDVIKDRLEEISQKHDIVIDKAAVELIAKNSHGSMRDAISLLEQAFEQADGNITEDVVKDMLGLTDPVHLFSLINALFDNDIARVVSDIEKFIALGKDSFLMISDMLDVLSDCIVAKYQGTNSICNSQQYIDCLVRLLDTVDVDSVYSIMNGLMDIRDELRRMPGKTTLVCGIIRMLSDEKGAYAKMAQKVAQLEKQIKSLSSGVVISSTPAVVPTEPIKAVEEQESTDAVSFKQEQAKKTDSIPMEVHTKQGQPEEDTVLMEIPVIAEQQEETAVKEETFAEEFNAMEEQTAQESATTTDPTMEEQEVSTSMEVPLEQEKQEEESLLDINDPFSMLRMFGGFVDTETVETKKVDEEKPVDEKKTSEGTDIDDYLITLYKDPVIESALEIGCTRTTEDGKVCFITEIEEIYRLIKAYDAIEQFPFLYKLKAAN